jgi:hypothetical protein
MKRLMVLIAILGIVNFSGCSYYQLSHGETKPHVSFVNLSNPKSNVTDGSTIYVWSPKNNAAVINKEGKGCIQGADVFHNQDGSIDVSNDLLKLVKRITIDANGLLSNAELLQLVGQLIETSAKIGNQTVVNSGETIISEPKK